MLKIILVFLLSGCFCECIRNGSGKILGGRYARKGEFPFILSISHGEYVCGATLVKWDKFVTAGHCFLDENGTRIDISVPIIIGGTLMVHNYKEKSTDPAAQVRKVIHVKFHVNFKPMKYAEHVYYHDVVLATLDEPFVKSPTLDLIRVPATDEKTWKQKWYDNVYSRKRCLGSGWGYTAKDEEDYPVNLSKYLKVVELKPWSDEKCRKRVLPGQVDMTSHGEVCLQSLRPNEGTCGGDSGSPLICEGYVYGVYRSGFDCGNDHFNVFFVLLWPYLKFLDFNCAVSTISLFNNIICLLIMHYNIHA